MADHRITIAVDKSRLGNLRDDMERVKSLRQRASVQNREYGGAGPLAGLPRAIDELRRTIGELSKNVRSMTGGAGGRSGDGGRGTGRGGISGSAGGMLQAAGRAAPYIGIPLALLGGLIYKIKSIGDAYYSTAMEQIDTMGRVGLQTRGRGLFTAAETGQFKAETARITGRRESINRNWMTEGPANIQQYSNLSKRFGIGVSDAARLYGYTRGEDPRQILAPVLQGLKQATGGIEQTGTVVDTMVSRMSDAVAEGFDSSIVARSFTRGFQDVLLSSTNRRPEFALSQMKAAVEAARGVAEGKRRTPEQFLTWKAAMQATRPGGAGEAFLTKTGPGGEPSILARSLQMSQEEMYNWLSRRDYAKNDLLAKLYAQYNAPDVRGRVNEELARTYRSPEQMVMMRPMLGFNQPGVMAGLAAYRQGMRRMRGEKPGDVRTPDIGVSKDVAAFVGRRQRREAAVMQFGATPYAVAEQLEASMLRSIGKITEAVGGGSALVTAVNALDAVTTATASGVVKMIDELKKLPGVWEEITEKLSGGMANLQSGVKSLYRDAVKTHRNIQNMKKEFGERLIRGAIPGMGGSRPFEGQQR